MVSESRERLATMCVSEAASLRDVLSAIETSGREIAFVVDSDDRVMGSLTDGDVRRALLGGHALDAGGVTSLMSRAFHSVQAKGNHRAGALDLMRAHGVSQIPVLDERGRLVGLHFLTEYLDREPLQNWGLVLAGGKGTRLGSITKDIPKPMLRVAGRPILERIVLDMVGAGFRRIFLSVNYKRNVIMDHFGDGAAHGCRIDYLEEDLPLGTGGPLSLLPEVPECAVLLMNGDLVGDFQFRSLLDYHAAADHALSVGVGLHQHTVPFGVVETQGGQVSRIHEKPLHHWWINYGVYAVSPELLSLVPQGVEYPVTSLIQTCLDQGLSVGAFELDGEWRDVGHPAELIAARGGQPLR